MSLGELNMIWYRSVLAQIPNGVFFANLSPTKEGVDKNTV